MNIPHTSIIAGLLLAFCSLSGFSQVNLQHKQTRIPANEQEIKTLTHTFLNHLVTGKIDQAGELLSPDFSNFASEKPMDKANFLSMWEGYHKTSTDASIKEGGLMAFEILDGPEKGTYAGVYALTSWTPKQTQKPVNVWSHMMLKVENGKISQIYEFQDNLSSMMQMGYTLNPPGSGE